MIRISCTIHSDTIETIKEEWLISTDSIRLMGNIIVFIANSPNFLAYKVRIGTIITNSTNLVAETLARSLFEDALTNGYVDLRSYKSTIIEGNL